MEMTLLHKVAELRVYFITADFFETYHFSLSVICGLYALGSNLTLMNTGFVM